jgi:hypothetical protein
MKAPAQMRLSGVMVRLPASVFLLLPWYANMLAIREQEAYTLLSLAKARPKAPVD